MELRTNFLEEHADGGMTGKNKEMERQTGTVHLVERQINWRNL